MNASELAKYLESDVSLTNACTEAANVIRKQHKVIVKLREALGSVMQYNEGQPEWVDALRTLTDTKEFNHD